MLDQNTKQIIDTARDILVGKLPAPNTQVDQITLAMLYKFMDDIDQEVIEYGGKPKYFSGQFQKYSWRELMRKSLSAQDRMNTYIEGLGKFSQNEELPETFREIFKNATVPYRDPEILTMFLTEIGKLEYLGDSEKLGDGYEYLLSVLGSQGGLGQFRTPRHIIDFIVSIVEPKKTDKILDPACGTAGFLISAYKNIVQNSEYKNLTYDEKNRILSNITGYDIEPSMVRIAKMNMYLHGCISPDIYEYDSLSLDDYWYEKFDVILANPPFMTPKGGINPHNKFQVKAKRAELLFVDYIAEHLKPEGKAGIIVPDSVLFNPNSKFKEVRKLLIDSRSIYAILSLPSGVFLPYSSVKTSILFIDKAIAPKANGVMFIEVNSDGFKLGNGRKASSENDLSWAFEILSSFKSATLQNGEYQIPQEYSDSVRFISVDEIKNNSYFLMSKKFKNPDFGDKKHEFFKLGDYIEEVKERVGNKEIDVWSVSNREGFVHGSDLFNERVASENISNYKVVFPNCFAYNPARINVGSIALNLNGSTGCVSPMYTVFKVREDVDMDPRFLFSILKHKNTIKGFSDNAYGSVRQQLRFDDLAQLYIPIPDAQEIEVIKQKLADLDEQKARLKNSESSMDAYLDKLFE